METIVCLAVLVLLLLLFEGMGILTTSYLKLENRFSENLLIGFWVYFSLFQIVALPMVLFKQTLSRLALVWGICLLIVGVLFCIALLRRGPEKLLPSRKFGKPDGYGIFLIVCVIGVCLFVLMQSYWGWDTAYYIGTINTSLYTDTMYQVHGETGERCTSIELRYALSMFYMNSAVFCRWFGISAVAMQKFVMEVLCVLLYSIVLYLLGAELFPKDTRKPAFFTSAVLLLNFFFVSNCTTSNFLLLRSYEAKSYCANVLVTALMWLLVCLWRKRKGTFQRIFILMFASVPISMSAILILPAILAVGVLAEAILRRKKQIVAYGILCAVPNLVYLVVYFLYTRGIFVIRV